MSVGFKNGTDGSVDIAVDAIKAAASGHTFLSVLKQGLAAIVETEGNSSTHVILRGSSKGPNYSAEFVQQAVDKLNKAGLPTKLMVSLKNVKVQRLLWPRLRGDGGADRHRSTAPMAIRQNNTSSK
jgi:phospho-2-dehydro-3-deoxyheptonate aldolase